MNPLLPGDPTVAGRLEQLHADLLQHRDYDLGFPGATDLPDMSALAPFERLLLNNVGHPFAPGGAYRMHTKHLEYEVVGFLADLFDAPLDNRHGYVTTGSTESTHWALWQARRQLAAPTVYCSSAAHYSVAKAAELLRMRVRVIPTDARGEIRYDLLHAAVVRDKRHRRGTGVIVVASVGTTMTEAVDDVARIGLALDTAGITLEQRWVHADAALAGVPLGLDDPIGRPAFTFTDGAHSIAISGHKFLATPFPCGVVIALADRHTDRGDITYTAAPDSTITGSRSGHAPLWLWYLLRYWGRPGLRTRAESARNLARYLEQQLRGIGWPAWRAQSRAFTVVFPRPPQPLLERWPLATDELGNAHAVMMPGVPRERVDRFVTDLRDALSAASGLGLISDALAS
ncbi:histidine decarboxylase [Dactylosporangium vinaceum]|uniref:Pyridoxal-dependent decarboxylase n=1 Tax=Dactylosporangium vinaceum TaxID=53362 RepID=A0ABV5MP52_9ACTN|nr:pyridoxal-dependent decarboxylase [Dactylosporangium vinaceum]UAB94518.1 histidine decarboxylase [Dactylosporangium vinaceum]